VGSRRKTSASGAAGAAGAALAGCPPFAADTEGDGFGRGKSGGGRSLSEVHEQLSIAQTLLAAALEEKAAVQAELGTVASALLKKQQVRSFIATAQQCI